MSMDSTASTLPLLGPDEVKKTMLPSSLEGIVPHDEFWFPDGNLILVAGNVSFRVYRGLLSAQSTVFDDMFSAASAVEEETFEGCPIVRLSDTPQELAHLFRILLPKSRRRLHPRKAEHWEHIFDEVAALARLSHKYHIEDVKEQALDLLCQWYTDSFDEWIIRKEHGSIVHAIGAVNIARLTNTTSMLPFALYSCCNLGPDLLDGWKREDGHVEYLSVEDLKICFAARERLCQEKAQISFKIFHEQPSKECSRVEQCRSALREMTQSLAECGLSRAVKCSVLLTWKSIIRTTASNHGVCVACKTELFVRDREARRQVWDKFPDIFGVSVPS